MTTIDQLNITTEILDVGEARRRLPRIRKLIETLARQTTEVRERHAQLEELSPDKQPFEFGQQQQAMQELQDDWRSTLKRLNDLGAYVKDPERGLIDFYTWKDGEIAFLCWQLGEPDIEHWHQLDEGFAGRKPI